MTLLVDKVHKQEPQCKCYVSHNHSYISSSGVADATLFYCYLVIKRCLYEAAIYTAVLVCALSAKNAISFNVNFARNNKNLFM